MRIPFLRMAMLTALATVPLAVHADVYRCIQPDGKTLYSDSPCPREAVQKSNISAAIGLCSTAECESRRQQAVEDARQRLRAEKEELAELTAKRHLAELETERARLDELRYRQAVETRLAAAADDAANAAAYPPYYSVFPMSAGVRPCGSRCLKPHHRPHQPSVPIAVRERGQPKLMDR
jgi:hypothetical protein